MVRRACLAVAASLLLLVTGLWQLEALFIQYHVFEQEGFMLPFGLKVPWWFARDLFYALIVIGYLILLAMVVSRE